MRERNGSLQNQYKFFWRKCSKFSSRSCKNTKRFKIPSRCARARDATPRTWSHGAPGQRGNPWSSSPRQIYPRRHRHSVKQPRQNATPMRHSAALTTTLRIRLIPLFCLQLRTHNRTVQYKCRYVAVTQSPINIQQTPYCPGVDWLRSICFKRKLKKKWFRINTFPNQLG
jgi:hypothetical protein